MKNEKIVYRATAANKKIEKTLGVFDSLQKAIEACKSSIENPAFTIHPCGLTTSESLLYGKT